MHTPDSHSASGVENMFPLNNYHCTHYSQDILLNYIKVEYITEEYIIVEYIMVEYIMVFFIPLTTGCLGCAKYRD